MSLVRFNISDRNECISGDLHGSYTDSLVAALTAEPETIAEFESALPRFLKPESDWPLLNFFRRYENLEPYDAGIVAIDLAGRTIGYDTTYSIPCAAGRVRVSGEFCDEDAVWIPYRIPDDWTFVETVELYEGTRDVHREDRSRNAPFDARPILFGRPLITYIALAVSDIPDLDSAEERYGDIHADWLMGRRHDLRDRTPRELFLEKQDFIDEDLQSRSLQWSMTKVCPAPLAKESFAYLNAAFGSHEWILYYDLFRYLIGNAVEQRRAVGALEPEIEITRLSKVRDEWLRAPDAEISGRTPLGVIDHERRRVNIAMSSSEILIDENCPCCVALAEDFDTPMFWFLDGCNMDDRFEFSSCKTIDEWEAEQRERERFNREFDRRYKVGADGFDLEPL